MDIKKPPEDYPLEVRTDYQEDKQKSRPLVEESAYVCFFLVIIVEVCI